jgi:long-chain acyl-CoA synthetase
VLAHRQHYRKPERSRFERVVKSRWDAVLVEPDDPMCVANNRTLVQTTVEALDLLPRGIARKLAGFRARVVDVDERLAAIEKLVKLYLPFMYEGYYVFESRAIDQTPALEPEWRYAPEEIEWRSYWLGVHVPGLRRWAFPLIEGKRPERYRPQSPVQLLRRDEATGEVETPESERADVRLPAAAEA